MHRSSHCHTHPAVSSQVSCSFSGSPIWLQQSLVVSQSNSTEPCSNLKAKRKTFKTPFPLAIGKPPPWTAESISTDSVDSWWVSGDRRLWSQRLMFNPWALCQRTWIAASHIVRTKQKQTTYFSPEIFFLKNMACNFSRLQNETGIDLDIWNKHACLGNFMKQISERSMVYSHFPTYKWSPQLALFRVGISHHCAQVSLPGRARFARTHHIRRIKYTLFFRSAWTNNRVVVGNFFFEHLQPKL